MYIPTELMSVSEELSWSYQSLCVPQCLQSVAEFAQCTRGRSVCSLPNEHTAFRV